MNIVHQYIHNKVLKHSSMSDKSEMPSTFKWHFLFNIPEYVENKPLLSEDQIPQLPEPRKISNEQALKYSPDQYGNDEDNELSPDPFDINEEQQIIENLKDKIITKPLQETIHENGQNEKEQEYSPDPYDVDENEQQYEDPVVPTKDDEEPIRYGGTKHGTIGEDIDVTKLGIVGKIHHEPRGTTIISPGNDANDGLNNLQRKTSSNYLDSWMSKESRVAKLGALKKSK